MSAKLSPNLTAFLLLKIITFVSNTYGNSQIQFPIETFFFELGDFGMGHFDLGDFGLGDFDLGDFGVNDFRHAGDYGPVEDYGLAATYGEYNDYPLYGHYQGAKVRAC